MENEIKFPSPEKLKEHFETLLKRREECQESGTIVGYENSRSLSWPSRHIGPEKGIGSANGVNYFTCENCEMPYETPWSSEQHDNFQRVMKMRFNI